MYVYLYAYVWLIVVYMERERERDRTKRDIYRQSTNTATVFSTDIGWLRLVGSLKLQVSFAKEPYKRDYFLQKRPIIVRSLLILAAPYLPLPLTFCISVSHSH